jgi:lipopolysaccharide transport system ATP-binding protein
MDYRTLRESLANAVKAPFRKRKRIEEFWALNEVSFEVQPGDVVGIVGRNGAGKSTLLKILSRIIKPTKGFVEMKGRVGSLLEVGTGFHPELTGRENVYLNGSILGMARREIAAKFDEIVAFAEVEKFLDTPVKRYSSGMYVRLAFAVAAHLEPEILIVDEVLAVGDAAFQKKCLGKMGEVSMGGRTILFVSHNMQAVTRLCTKGIMLADGKIMATGGIEQVVQAYMSGGQFGPAKRAWETGCGPGNQIAKLVSARICSESGETAQIADIRKPVGIEIEYDVAAAGHLLVSNYHLYNTDGICVFIAGDIEANRRGISEPGRYRSTMWIPGNTLAEGTISVGVALSSYNPDTVHFYEPDAVAFEVVDSMEGGSARGEYSGSYPGVVRPIFPWENRRLTDAPPAEPKI